MIYATGWGAVLSVGFVFCAAQAVAIEGSPAVFPATVWSLVCLAGAEVAVGLGWAPSVVSTGSESRHRGVDGGRARVRDAHRLGQRARPRDRGADAWAKAKTASGVCSSTRPTRSWCSTATGMIVFATEAIEAVTGYSVEELVGRTRRRRHRPTPTTSERIRADSKGDEFEAARSIACATTSASRTATVRCVGARSR